MQDSSHPDFNSYPETLTKVESLKSANRESLCAYFCLPLQIFGYVRCKLFDLTSKGAFFNPYMALQDTKMLEYPSTKSYVIGSSNALLWQQAQDIATVKVNVK